MPFCFWEKEKEGETKNMAKPRKKNNEKKNNSVITPLSAFGFVASLVFLIISLVILPFAFAKSTDIPEYYSEQTNNISQFEMTSDNRTNSSHVMSNVIPDQNNNTNTQQEDEWTEDNTDSQTKNSDNENPYHGKYTLRIEIGSQFANYVGDDFTEGYIYEVNEGDTILFPQVIAKTPYTFVGWSIGGVKEPDWGIDTPGLEVSSDDEEGNGYCVCGDYRPSFFSDNISEYVSEYNNYKMTSNNTPNGVFTPAVVLGIFIIALITAFIIIWNGNKGKTPVQNEKTMEEEDDDPVL